FLTIALGLNLGGLLDTAKILVFAVGCLHRELLPLEAHDLGDLFDGQAAFLVEGDSKVLAVRTGDFQDGGRLVADLLLAGCFALEAAALERHEQDRDDGEIDVALLASDAVALDLAGIVAELAPAFVAVENHDTLELVVAELPPEVIESLEGRLGSHFIFIA